MDISHFMAYSNSRTHDKGGLYALTIRNIAEQAGVAISTVSLVLNNKAGVRKQTRERVAALLVQNGYTIRNQPDPAGKGDIKFIRYQSAQHRKERNEDFFAGILNGAEQKARLSGYSLSVTNADDEHFFPLLRQLEETQAAAGVILLGSELRTGDAEPLTKLSLPLVSVDNRFPNMPINTVSINNTDGVFHAVEYLYRLGHRKIGCLQGSFDIGGVPARNEGFLRAMEALELPVDPRHLIQIDLLFDKATEQMHRHLRETDDLPTAFFAANDIVAAGCERALQQAGYRVPEDISIIGFDDGTMSTFVDPPLTTMRVDRARLGELAVQRLLDMIANGGSEVLKTELTVTLVERASTAQAKV